MGDSYSTFRMGNPRVSFVDAGGGRKFLVVQFGLNRDRPGPHPEATLVFERSLKPDCWISRRELNGVSEMDPDAAVLGLLFSGHPPPSPIDELKRDLGYQRQRNAILRKEVARLTERMAKGAGKRGKRGRRDP